MRPPLHRAAATLAAGAGLLPRASAATCAATPSRTCRRTHHRSTAHRYADKAVLLLYSAVDAQVSIRGAGYNRTVPVAGGRFMVVELMGGSQQSAPQPMVTEHCRPVSNTFLVEASEPIIVYQYLVTKFGTEAWSAIPVESWGRDYYAAAMPGEVGSNVSPGGDFDYNRTNSMFPAEIVIVAAYPDTRVTIVPNGSIHTNCDVTDVTLQAGEAFSVQSYVDTAAASAGSDQPDLGGTRIFATMPVGVISGNTRAQLVDESIGLGKNSFKNMQIEWLAPVEQHGTEFVYLPTWDARRPVAPYDSTNGIRKAEFVRVYSTSPGTTTSTFTDSAGGIASTGPGREPGGFNQIRLRPDRATVIRTSQPAQVVMQSAGTVKYAGTTSGFGGYIGAAYDGWGGYMVELTPREQWVSFAPFYASSHPSGMEHFINVVTDTAHRNDVYLRNGARFEFDRGVIAGSDLVWGTMPVTPGVDNHLEGRNGATFAGHVYGTLSRGGHEEFRPGGGPAQYEEYLAIAYGYPLAPRRLVTGEGDSLRIGWSTSCSGTCLEIASIDADPVGLRSVRLELAANARIISEEPSPLTGTSTARVCVGPINPLLDASAQIVIADRSGKVTVVPYTRAVDSISLDRERLDYGTLPPSTPDTLSLTISNPLPRPIEITGARLLDGTKGFRIVAPARIGVALAERGRQTLLIEANAAEAGRSYSDTLVIEYVCGERRVPLTASTIATDEPCLMVSDIDFGTLTPGMEVARTMRISNVGGGEARLDNPGGGDVVTWASSVFGIAATELDRLRAVVLRGGEHVDVVVTFRADDTGAYRTTARVWASTRSCRDTSVWSARVSLPSAAPGELDAVFALHAATPNPVTSVAEIRFSLERATHTTLVVYDERGRRVATLVDATLGAGTHTARLDASSLPAGVYHYRLSSGTTSRSRTLVRHGR